MTDPELVSRVAVSDDHAAFRELVQRHQSAVRHFLRHLTSGDAALADDLAQDTFIQAYRGIRNFHGRSTFATWLLGIAHNHSRNARRRQRTTPIESAHWDRLEPAPSAVSGSDLRHDLALALRQLDPDTQAVFHLCYQQGLSHGEIADVLQCPLGTVKTQLNRGKEKLRPLLASWNHR